MTSTALVTFRRQQGVTLVELVIGIIVLSIVTVSISTYVATGMKVFVASKDNVNALSKINYSFERMIKEIRKVNHDGSAYQITTPASDMTDTTFKFVNTDGATITLNYDGVGQVVHITDSSVNSTAYTLIDQVTAFDFNYYESDGVTGTNNPALLVFVEFSFTKQEGSVSYSNRKRVLLRDLQ